MKTNRILVMVMALAVASAAALAVATDAHAGASSPKKAEEFRSTPGYEKLDLRLRQAWDEKPSGRNSLECILKASARLGEDDQAALAAAGFDARTVIGSIATGSLKSRDVPDVANLPFVQVMELAVPMNLKDRNP